MENDSNDQKLMAKVTAARDLYGQHFANKGSNPTIAAVAPGRVNFIGEHTDYTGGYVLPLAIDYSTVVYGSGSFDEQENCAVATATLEFMSTSKGDGVTKVTIDSNSSPPDQVDWTTYVVGTIYQYLQIIQENHPETHLQLQFAIAGDVPLGAGLSSSASLEVALACWLEKLLLKLGVEDLPPIDPRARAVRCQKAENTWCKSPCGIMDQYVSSAGQTGQLLLIDCTSLECELVQMKQQQNAKVSLVVTNSNVQHDIAAGEYPVRVKQCQSALEALQKHNPTLESLRQATWHDVQAAANVMDPVSFQRAKHVVTENERVLVTKQALAKGDWESVGRLMNASHNSMRDDYQVSCYEIDVLVELAQTFDGVYGSRLTGGGFGGCTVTLVEQDRADALVDHLKQEYSVKTRKECVCFVTQPAPGARVLDLERMGIQS